MKAYRPPLLVPLPPELDDATAAALLDFLHQAAYAIEAHYADQLLRHYHRPDPRQQPLWDDDPPF